MWTRSYPTTRWKESEIKTGSYESSRVTDDIGGMLTRFIFHAFTISSSSLSLPRIRSSQFTVLVSFALILSLSFCVHAVGANIDCFKCVSLNGNNPSCEDPFHNNYSTAILESPCMGGRKGREGTFPATACIKLAGTYDDTGEKITVRGCALDSGTLTTDTEIIRMSHCGSFYFDERYVKGCLQSCDDADGCNGSLHVQLSLLPLLLSITLQLAIKLIFFLPVVPSSS